MAEGLNYKSHVGVQIFQPLAVIDQSINQVKINKTQFGERNETTCHILYTDILAALM